MKKSVDKASAANIEQLPQVSQTPVVVAEGDRSLPVLIKNAGPSARFAWEEFIYGQIRNAHARFL